MGPGLSNPVSGIGGRGLRPVCLMVLASLLRRDHVEKHWPRKRPHRPEPSVPYRHPCPRGTLAPTLSYVLGPVSPQNQSRATAPSYSGRRCRACDLDSGGLNSPRKREVRTKGRGPQRGRRVVGWPRAHPVLPAGCFSCHRGEPTSSQTRIRRHGALGCAPCVEQAEGLRGRWVSRVGELRRVESIP